MSVMLEMLSTVFPIDGTSVAPPVKREGGREREGERGRDRKKTKY